MTPERISAWSAARNVLAVRLDGMGDLIMTTPALRALKEAVPGRRLALWTSSAGAALASMLPEVDEVIAFDAPWMKHSPGTAPARDRAIIDRLAAGEFDAAVLFSLHSQSILPAALACYLAGIPLRVGRCRENPYHLLTDWIREDELDRPRRHDVRRQLDLCAAIGAPPASEALSLRVTPAAACQAAEILRDHGFEPGGPWCIIHPGASAPSRRYPAELFGAVAAMLVRQYGWRVLVSGAAGESALTATVADAAGAGALAFDTSGSLELLAALIQRAPVLVTNNTGPAHIAAAVGTPVVDLYALTNPQHTPWQVPHRTLSHDVPCRYCYRSVCPEGHHECLRLIPPREVVAAAVELAAETAPVPVGAAR